MSRKLEYIPRIPIAAIERDIALWEAQGYYDQAEGLRWRFEQFIDNERITKLRAEYKEIAERLGI